MKSFILVISIMLALILPGCKSKSAEPAISQTTPSRATATPRHTPSPSKKESSLRKSHATVTDEDGNVLKGVEPDLNTQIVNKSAKDLYDFLSTKGWGLKGFKQDELGLFSSHDGASCSQGKVNFFILQYESVDKAMSIFDDIDIPYRQKLGRAVLARNFIVTITPGISDEDTSKVIKLTEKDYIKLQSDLNEFCQKS